MCQSLNVQLGLVVDRANQAATSEMQESFIILRFWVQSKEPTGSTKNCVQIGTSKNPRGQQHVLNIHIELVASRIPYPGTMSFLSSFFILSTESAAQCGEAHQFISMRPAGLAIPTKSTGREGQKETIFPPTSGLAAG